MTVVPVTAPQRDFINQLLLKRDTTGTAYEGWTPDWDRATKKAASSVITYLLTLPLRKAVEATGPEPEAGVYWIHGDHLVRVYLGQKNHRMLAQRVNVEVDGDETTVSYEYLGLAAKVLVPEATPKRLSLDEVGSLGVTFGHCLVCARLLTVPESVDRGIGPVCAEKY